MSLAPIVSFAQVGDALCSNSGYTIATINGVLTNDEGARDNMVALSKKVGFERNGQIIDYQFLLNPSHFKGVGDAFKVVIQKFFENETVKDYDLAQMFIDASQKVKTQKLLLVAHSQGNFYANSFYDIATKEGGVLPQSLGVYAVASPSNHLAKRGSGLWLTSDTDHVIAGLVGGTVGSIVPPNIHIAEVAGDTDPFSGHDFSGVYLKYVPNQVVTGVYESLRRISSDPYRNPNAPCIIPPPSLMYSLLYKTESGAFFVIDTTLKTVPQIATAIKETAIYALNGAVNITVTVGSSVYNTIVAALTSGTVAGNNSAVAILATQTPQTAVPVNSSVVTTTNSTPQTTQPTTVTAPTSQKPQTVFVFEPKVQSGTNAPKLVFVGSFVGGGGVAPQILGMQTTVFVADEATATGEVVGNAGVALATPALSTPQCAQTLATDGCLLATTTVRFEWSAVAGADHYLINKNGEYATTTDTSLDITARDFSDYTLGVVAVGAGGQASATSTQAVSFATIPIAINEIAWMGTRANWRDEWFEIKNNTSRTIDLSQWKLNAKDGTPHVELAGVILPHAYIIFERTDDNAVFGVAMHATSTGDLNDDGDQITLSHSSITFDQTPVITDGNWAAGTTTTRSTMERYSSRELGTDPANWGTNLGYIKNGTDANGNAIEGTPGAQNSVSTLINKGQDITNDFTLTADEERYVVPNQILITASSTLLIEPGVVIQFYSGGFVVNGALNAQGTAEDPIIFNSFSKKRAGDFWVDNATGTSTFEYAHFENMNNVFYVDGGVLEIRNSEFVNTDGGVDVDGASSTVLIENTNFASSTSDTIGVYNGGTLRIASSTITNQLDNNAIYLDRSSLVMASTTIDGVHDGNGVGAYDSFVSIASSTVRNTEGDAIWLSNSTTTIANTVVQGGELNDEDGTSGISIYGGVATIADTTVSGFISGSGIVVDTPREPVVIIGGEVAGNATGVEMYPAGSAFIEDVSSVHDNGTSEADNVVVW